MNGVIALLKSFGLVGLLTLAAWILSEIFIRRSGVLEPFFKKSSYSNLNRSSESANFFTEMTVPYLLVFVVIFLLCDMVSLSLCNDQSIRNTLLSLTQSKLIVAGNDGVNGEALSSIAGNAIVADYQLKAEQSILGLWARVLSATLISLFMFFRIPWQKLTWQQIKIACIAWLIFIPFIFVVNFFVTYATTFFETTPDVHPLNRIGTNWHVAPLFILSACIATPIFEEWFVRGVLLPFAAKSLERSIGIIAFSAVMIFSFTKGVQIGPLIFYAVLVFGFWLLLQRTSAETSKAYAAVYASSVFFAMAHSSVWPSPLPLFLLSILFGWLAIRTGGIACSIIVHGLFNAVSTFYVLLGGK